MPRKKKKKNNQKPKSARVELWFFLWFSPVELSDRSSLELVSHERVPRAVPTEQKCSCRKQGWFRALHSPLKPPPNPNSPTQSSCGTEVVRASGSSDSWLLFTSSAP